MTPYVKTSNEHVTNYNAYKTFNNVVNHLKFWYIINVYACCVKFKCNLINLHVSCLS